ncbi:MAG TPA: homocysteine S-methyltransferase family protein [Phycisphaerae bacterium]|nr:homocysteine S-methyltransferase family protein [Phycisphaerae bacterium]
MQPLLERLAAGDVLVADGAMGTMLQAEGLEPGQCPESFNLTRPQVLLEIARQYLEAGADIIQTNTFGGSPARLAMHQLADRTDGINRAAVRAVCDAVGDRAYVSGSCGPSGRILKPYGDTDPQDLYAGFRRQIECLIDAGVDCVCVETMVDLNEATLAVKAAKDASPSIPVLATMTFDATPRGFYTIMGVSVEAAAGGLADAGADVVGSNCGNGIERMVEIAGQFHEHSRLPLIIQSNAGLPQMQDGKPVYRETPEFMADRARALIEVGVSIIGGCCGTTPQHIRALRRMVDASGRR